MEYRNVKDGRIVTRPYQDEWLEASAGWERVHELVDVTALGDAERTLIDEEGTKQTEAFEDVLQKEEE